MNSIQKALQQDASKLTKAEIVDLLTKLHDTIGQDKYGVISGVDVQNELAELKKSDMVAIVGDFRDHYEASWEDAANAGLEAFDRIAGIARADTALFSSQNVDSANFAAELGSIDFANLIGGPMQAAVQAQAAASMSTVRFINDVGFDRDETTGAVTGLKMADFTYERVIPDPDDPTATVTDTVEITVPFISILNVPSLRIETLEIDFNVKLNSTYTNKVESTFDTAAKGSYGSKWFSPVKFEASIAYQRKSTTGTTIEKEYSMGVKVVATNDEMPAGLDKVLGLLSA